MRFHYLSDSLPVRWDGDRSFELDLPGLSAEDVNASLEGGTLRLAFKYRGYDWSPYYRLPTDVDVEKVGVSMKNGVLKCQFPPKAEASRQLQISTT